MQHSPNGMRDTVAVQSAITWVDGASGQLRYRGYPIGELADRCTYEEVAFLIWNADMPDESQIRDLRTDLRQTRRDSQSLTKVLMDAPRDAHPLDVLRHIVSWDALRNPLTWENTPEANGRKSVEFTAWFPVIVASYHRLRHGLQPVAPDPSLDSAANFLYMLHDRQPSEVAVKTLDTSMILHAEHELNASTFSARVTIATQSNLHAAIISALGTLTGPRHGGASEQVIQMLEEIGDPEQADSYVSGRLARRERIMGFGHAVYKTVDPRSTHLKAMAKQLLSGTAQQPWVSILEELETVMRREKNLYPNVDLYAAVVNHALGIDPAFYTSIFACSRICGWTAHVQEQLADRMIRPSAQYVGPQQRNLPSV